jgi:hypothetical protein
VKKTWKNVLNRPVVVGAALGLVVILAVVQTARVLGTRSESRAVVQRTQSLRTEIADLEVQLAEERSGRERSPITRGRGPGGIYSPWEAYLFEGPTAAQSALDLATVADDTFFRTFRYSGEDSRVLSTFPPEPTEESGDVVPLPVREHYRFVEWPLEVYLESDYDSLIRLLKHLTYSEPAIAIREVEFEVFRDDQDRPTDRVTFNGLLSTYWLRKDG